MGSRELQQVPTPGRKVKKCQVCGKMCSDDTSLDSHYSFVHPEMKLICLKCPNIIMFSSMSALKNHYSKHGSKIPESPPSFGCSYCNHAAPTKERLGDHVRTAHSFYCRHKLCSFKTTSKEALQKHFSATHEFRCSAMKCSFIADSKDKLNTHINDAHMHRCELCSFRSPQENVLRIHVRKMHVEKIRCGQCTMLVPKSEMATHKMMQHNSGKESPATQGPHENLNDERDLKGGTRKLYPCPECQVNFSSLDVMKEHVKTRHKKQVEVIYKCPKNRCQYQTPNRLQMQRHQKEQHSSEKSNVHVGPAKPITFDCQFCDFTAKSMDLLREHRSIHLQKPQEPEEDVDLHMEVTSEDVPPPIEMEVTNEDMPIPMEEDVAKKDEPTPLEGDVTSDDAPVPDEKAHTTEEDPSSIVKEVTQKNLPTPTETEIEAAEEDVPPSKEEDASIQDVPPPIQNDAIGGDVPLSLEKEAAPEIVTPPIERGTMEGALPVGKEGTKEDVASSMEEDVVTKENETTKNETPPIEKEVTNENMQPSTEKENANEDVSPPIGTFDSQDDEL